MGSSGSTRNLKIVLIGMPSWGVEEPFHSLALVAGVARSVGFTAEAHDLNIEFYHHVAEADRKYWSGDLNYGWFSNELPERLWQAHRDWIHGRLDEIINNVPPALIAFSVNSWTRYFSVRGAKHLKLKWPEIPILFGGVDCFPGEQNTAFLSSSAKDSYCDIICQGECEISFKKFLKDFNRTGDWKTKVPGFAYFKNGILVDTGPGELPFLQDKQPLPAFDLFDLSRYTHKGALPFFLSRGCIYRCSFCSEKSNFGRYRYRRAEEAFEELMAIIPLASKQARVPTLHLSDSIINARMRELDKFLDLIINNDIKVDWGGQAHIHHELTYEVLSKMHRAGCRGIFWGIETGSQHVVDLMNKHYSVADARRILNDCSSLGIGQWVPIIIGFPGETPEDLVDTIEFILLFKDKSGIEILPPHGLVITRKSPLYKRCEEFGLANTDQHVWHTVDFTNTLPIRIVRRFVACQASHNQTLSVDDLVDTEEICGVNLDGKGVANDLFSVIHEMCRRADTLHLLYSEIDQWPRVPAWRKGLDEFLKLVRPEDKTSPSLEDILPKGIAKESDPAVLAREKYRRRWLNLSKSLPKQRDKLYRLILRALKELKATVKQAE